MRIKKIVRYIFWGVLCGALLVALSVVLLYVPFVQDFVCRQAEHYLKRHANMELTLPEFRLKFPLRLSVGPASAVVAGKDTLFRCQSIDLDVAFLPLLRGEVVVRRFDTKEVLFAYADSASGMKLRVETGEMSLPQDRIGLADKRIDLDRIDLRRVRVGLTAGRTVEDTVAKDTAAVPWRIGVRQVLLDGVDFSMTTIAENQDLRVRLDTCRIDSVAVNMLQQSVSVHDLLLRGGSTVFCTKPAPPQSPTGESVSNEQTVADSSPLWTISLGRLALADYAVEYDSGIESGNVPGAFDPNHIVLTGLNLSADSVFYRGEDLRVDLMSLSAKERSGLELVGLDGMVRMDSREIQLASMDLKTGNSSLRLDAKADRGVLSGESKAALWAKFDLAVGLRDVMYAVPLENRALRRMLLSREVIGSGSVRGTFGKMVAETKLDMPHVFGFSIEGSASIPTSSHPLDARTEFSLQTRDSAFYRSLLAAFAMEKVIAVPQGTRVSGTFAMNGNELAPDIRLSVDSGYLEVRGTFDPTKKRYAGTVVGDGFPLDRILPGHSFGYLGMEGSVRGTGFDIYAPQSDMEVGLVVNRFDFNGYDYGRLAVAAGLSQGALTGHLSESSEALRFEIDMSGLLSGPDRKIVLTGRLDTCNFYGLNLMSEPFTAAADLCVSAASDGSGVQTARVALDRIELWTDEQKTDIRPTEASVSTGKEGSAASVHSGDLDLRFTASGSIDSVAGAFGRLSGQTAMWIEKGAFDMDSVASALPAFRLAGTAGAHNLLNGFLSTKGVQFDSLALDVESGYAKGPDVALQLTGLTTGKMALDTVAVHLGKQERKMAFDVELQGRPKASVDVADVRFSGFLVDSTIRLQCVQTDRQGRIGYNFGWNGVWSDSTITVRMDEQPVFGFSQWTVNPDNYLSYRLKKAFAADFRLSHENKQVSVVTQQDSVVVHVAGIDVASTLKPLPGMPPLGGMFGADAALKMDAGQFGVYGAVRVDSLSYEGRRVADLYLSGAFHQDSLHTEVGGQMDLDGSRALSVQGKMLTDSTGSSSVFDLDLAGLPLAPAQAFLPEGTIGLSGSLQGHLSYRDTLSRPVLSGGLWFTDTRVDVPMIGTSFGMAPDTISIENSILQFSNYGIVAPNKEKLFVEGTVDLNGADHRIRVDTRLHADRFQFVDVARSRKTMVYGTGYMGLDASAHGAIDDLAIRGNVKLLPGTAVSYVMQESAISDLQNQTQQMVEFVSFNDTASMADTLRVPSLRIGGLDLLLEADIDPSVRLGVDLSEDGQNRVDLQGGGTLTYAINRLGDASFTGRYVVQSGTVRYNPPVISQKNFNITQGSYVEWLGDLMNPMLNITAVETVRTNVTSDDGSGNDRSVSFDISVMLRNRLDELSVSFGLSAPTDLTMQNQLSSMTAEERADQAMGLLIYNTYTGPGTTAKVNTSNPINTFITKELNQWAQNNLKGVDLSFGIDTYDNTAVSGETGTRTDYSYQLSKNLFNSRVRAMIGGKFSTDADPTENLKENLIDDVALEYQLTKRDNMFLKLFRHTGYESILEGEVTETGIGFVIRKRVLKISDLFRVVRERVRKNEVENRNGER